ncbi:hypothetical protein CAEBREN_10008 [Caenorhabditis brenneri]|uniref:Uncharacterized protein n=1 Tax=Caenorhabditis brenneri TaxID=135651 RepID=G0NBW2_CAEBE|nr:hypothetical protein CAEBREN_10008 [Caenorhabditis brenneri]
MYVFLGKKSYFIFSDSVKNTMKHCRSKRDVSIHLPRIMEGDETFKSNLDMEENLQVIATKSYLTNKMKRKIEKGSVEERVMAILTANSLCQESPSKEGQLEVHPMLSTIREKIDEKCARLENKKRLFAIKELAPVELEVARKLEEQKYKRNLYARNQYHALPIEIRREMNKRKAAAKRQKSRENSLHKTEVEETKNVQFLGNLSNNDEPLDFAKDPEVLTVPETFEVPEAASSHDINENMEIEGSQTSANSVTIDSRGKTPGKMRIKKPFKPKELTESQKIQRREEARRKYREMPEDKKKAMMKKGTEYTRKRRQKLREEKAKNAQLQDKNPFNKDEPLDEKNLKMLLDIIQSLGPIPAEQGK